MDNLKRYTPKTTGAKKGTGVIMKENDNGGYALHEDVLKITRKLSFENGEVKYYSKVMADAIAALRSLEMLGDMHKLRATPEYKKLYSALTDYEKEIEGK